MPASLSELQALQILDLSANLLASFPASAADIKPLSALKLGANATLRSLPVALLKKLTVKIEIVRLRSSAVLRSD